MPVLSGAVTLARFRSEPAARSDAKRWLLRGLAKKAFRPLELRKAEADRSAGFVELEDHDATAFEGGLLHGAYALFAWRVDTIKVPAAAVKAELERWAAAFAGEQGRPPSKGEKRRRKDEITQLLRQRTQPVSRTFDVSWNLKSGEVAIWAASRKVVDEIALALEEGFGVKLAPRSVNALAMQAGLQEAPLGPTAALVGLAVGGEVARGEA